MLMQFEMTHRHLIRCLDDNQKAEIFALALMVLKQGTCFLIHEARFKV